MRYILYNADRAVAAFEYNQGMIVGFEAIEPALISMQIRDASADGFTMWLHARTMDLNNFKHCQLVKELIASRDKTAIAVMTHMFSIQDQEKHDIALDKLSVREYEDPFKGDGK